MNSIERVAATLEGKPTDRRAISLTLPLYGARLTGCQLTDYYTDPAAYARGQSAVRECFEPDILFGPFALPLLGAAFGSQVRFFDDQAPNLRRPAIASADEVDQLDWPDVDSQPTLLYFREAIRLMSAEHGREVPIAAVALSPVDLPVMILGLDAWLQTLLFDPAGTQRMLDLTIPHFIRWANALLAGGASLVALPAACVNPKVVMRQIVEEIAVPAMKKAFQDLDGPILLHHAGAPIAPFLDLLTDLPKVVAFCVDPADDLREAREKLGPAPALMGKIEGPGLVVREADDIEAECRAILRDRRDDPRFILGSSGADIDMDTRPENIRAFRRAAESFSREAAR